MTLKTQFEMLASFWGHFPFECMFKVSINAINSLIYFPLSFVDFSPLFKLKLLISADVSELRCHFQNTEQLMKFNLKLIYNSPLNSVQKYLTGLKVSIKNHSNSLSPFLPLFSS